jgi:hypothetical protein
VAGDPAATASAISEGKTPGLLAAAPPGARGGLDHLVRAVFTSGLDHIQLIAGVIGLAGGVLVLLLVRPTRGALLALTYAHMEI